MLVPAKAGITSKDPFVNKYNKFFHKFFPLFADHCPLNASRIYNSRIVYTTIFVLKSVKNWSKAAHLLYKNGHKLYKSAHNWAFFGRFSTVQQYPECVFAPINTDSPP